METQSRERISIDLQGLKPALLARSQAQGVSPSELVRKALEQALGAPAEAEQGADHRPHLKRSGDRRAFACAWSAMAPWPCWRRPSGPD